jgi:hypothetical protein
MLHFGVTFSDSDMTATMHEKVKGNWYEYSELDGGAWTPSPTVTGARGFTSAISSLAMTGLRMAGTTIA